MSKDKYTQPEFSLSLLHPRNWGGLAWVWSTGYHRQYSSLSPITVFGALTWQARHALWQKARAYREAQP